MEGRDLQREVVVAIGLKDGTWKQATINVPEPWNNVLDESEVKRKAEEIAGEIYPKIAFIKVLHIDDPEGGYAEDHWGI
jgi:hypothetical protein